MKIVRTPSQQGYLRGQDSNWWIPNASFGYYCWKIHVGHLFLWCISEFQQIRYFTNGLHECYISRSACCLVKYSGRRLRIIILHKNGLMFRLLPLGTTVHINKTGRKLVAGDDHYKQHFSKKNSFLLVKSLPLIFHINSTLITRTLTGTANSIVCYKLCFQSPIVKFFPLTITFL